MHDPDHDHLLPAEVAFARAATAAKYIARKLSAAATLQHVSATRVAELAKLLEQARELYDRLAEGEPDDDPALGDTQVAEVDASLMHLIETRPDGSRRGRR